MKYLILIIVGVAGIIFWSYFGRKRVSNTSLIRANKRIKSEREKENGIREDAEKKRENLEKARRIFAERDRAANDDVEKLLGVSDATATRYLDELEKEGFIRQVGKTGKHVYYEKV